MNVFEGHFTKEKIAIADVQLRCGLAEHELHLARLVTDKMLHEKHLSNAERHLKV